MIREFQENLDKEFGSNYYLPHVFLIQFLHFKWKCKRIFTYGSQTNITRLLWWQI